MLSDKDIEIERLKSDLINMREERDILQAIVDNFNKTIAGVPALARAERLQSENARLTALLAALAEDVRAESSLMNKDKEQAAFEKWLTRTSPSGDCESVHAQWLESSDHEDLFESEDVRAVVEEPVAYQVKVHGMTLYWNQPSESPSAVNTPLYRHPQRPVVLPERKPDTRGLKAAYFEGWNACLDAVEELNK